MGRETSKSHDRRARNGDFKKYFQGKGLDIGCGSDPVLPTAQRYDKQHGNAETVSNLEPESYDYVYSSHCLEHMTNEYGALRAWWGLVKPGGYLIVVVPDFILYEQKHWPSVYNTDHKHIFEIDKLCNMGFNLPMSQVLRVQINEDGFDYSKHSVDQTRHGAQAEIEMIVRKQKDPFYTYSLPKRG